jgi:CoA:oxalate CoA-transferase
MGARSALDICAEHTRQLGADVDPWTPAPEIAEADEVLAQATSGLMAIHGRDGGAPRAIALPVVSVATAVLAVQGVLAAQLCRMRGLDLGRVATSSLSGAVEYLRHHLAIATSGGSFPFEPLTSGDGPPFPTCDGHWVELEAMGPELWLAFWKALQVPESVGVRAWLPYVYRYLAGRCVLPPELHVATAQRTLDELTLAAAASGVALCRVRRYAEVSERSTTWTFTRRGGPASAARRAQTSAPPVDSPLAGVRVVEVTSRLQGPLAGQLLRMLGADVTKIEPPGGDFGRRSPPLAGTIGAAYRSYNHGKRVEELDYKRAADRARLLELVSEADVFLHNWPRGRAEQLELDFACLAACNPRLVYAHAAGWSKSMVEPVPIAGDQLVQAFAGCADLLATEGAVARPSRLTIVDTMGGLIAAEGILAALCARERDPRPIAVETSLFDAALLFCRNAPVQRAYGPLDQPLATGSGYLSVRPPDDRARQYVASLPLMSRSAQEWVLTLTEMEIPAAMVRTDLGAVPSEWMQSGVVRQVDGACWVPGVPWSFRGLASQTVDDVSKALRPSTTSRDALDDLSDLPEEFRQPLPESFRA